VVKFLRSCGIYNASDTAVFRPEFETRLITDGFAVDVKEEDVTKTKDTVKNPEKPQTRQTVVGPQTR